MNRNRKRLIEIYGEGYKQTLELRNSLWFGKYKNSTVENIIEEDVGYMEWCLGEKIFTLNNEAFKLYQEKLDEMQDAENFGDRKGYGLDKF